MLQCSLTRFKLKQLISFLRPHQIPWLKMDVTLKNRSVAAISAVLQNAALLLMDSSAGFLHSAGPERAPLLLSGGQRSRLSLLLLTVTSTFCSLDALSSNTSWRRANLTGWQSADTGTLTTGHVRVTSLDLQLLAELYMNRDN